MQKLEPFRGEVWFVTGGSAEPAIRKKVAADAKAIVRSLNDSAALADPVVFQPVVGTAEEIGNLLREAQYSSFCVGVIFWMHSFVSGRYWINGLKNLHKPMLHLHTQSVRDIPWTTLDPAFLDVNQSAYGDREFGYVCARMGLKRKVVAGDFADPVTLGDIDTWMRAANAVTDARTLKVARFGDNMRGVAVSEGDKVAAQIQFGYEVEGYGVSDLARFVKEVEDRAVDDLTGEYETLYTIPVRTPDAMRSIREAARLELGLRAFLTEGGFRAFTTSFQDLGELDQLPGLACQRLMSEGYGYGGEGDWKVAALLRAVKVMAEGLPGGTSFMEDFACHLEPERERMLASHMLEVCPSLATRKPTLEVHPLAAGGRNPAARLVFDTPAGAGVISSLMELEDGFHLLCNEVDAVKPDEKPTKLGSGRAVWIPKPNFHTGVAEWIEAGGGHHNVFTQALDCDFLFDFADLSGIDVHLIE